MRERSERGDPQGPDALARFDNVDINLSWAVAVRSRTWVGINDVWGDLLRAVSAAACKEKGEVLYSWYQLF